MRSKRTSLVQLVFQVVALLLLFMPLLRLEVWTEVSKEYYVALKLTYSEPRSFVQMIEWSDTHMILGIATIILMAIGIVLFTIKFIGKMKSKNLFIPSVVVLQVICLAIFTLIGIKRDNYGYQIPITYFFYIEAFLLVALAIITIIDFLSKKNGSIEVRYIKEQPAIKRETNTSSQNDTTDSKADELKIYKELLDIGAITQREYDEKKRQIIGM